MGDLTPGEIFAILCGLLLAAAGAVNTVGSALEKIAKARKAAQAPNEEQDRRLRELEKRMDKAEKKLQNDNDQLQAVNDCMRVLLQGQLALLDHGLDGNNIKQMQDAKEVLQHHLINTK